MVSLGEGWSVVEWELTDAISPEDRSRLEALGVAVAPSRLRVGFAGDPPRRVELTPRGDEFPVWRPGDEVRVRVAPAGEGAPREATLFALGPRGLSSVTLSDGSSWIVTLSELTPGRYGVRVEAWETSVPVEECFFEVRDGADGAWPTAAAAFEGVDTTAELDLSAALERVTLRAPPFWSVRARWEEGAPLRLDPARADESGVVDLASWRAALAPRVTMTRQGRLGVSAGALGAWSLQHRRLPAAEAVLASLRARWESLGAAVEASAMTPAALFDAWIRPVLMDLGWSVPPAWNPALASEDVAAVMVRSPHGVRALLVALPASRWGEPTFAALSSRFSDDGAHDIVATDGTQWRLFDARRRRWRYAVSIATALASERDWKNFHQEFDTG